MFTRFTRRAVRPLLAVLTLVSALLGSMLPAYADTTPGQATEPPLRGIYVSAYTAGSPNQFARILGLLDRTDLNAVVIDAKTDWGTISFATDDPEIQAIGADDPVIKDLPGLLETLRLHRIYRIARIVTFKDVPATKAHPEWAVADVDGGLWKDNNGMSWLDPYNKNAWDYVVRVAKAAARAGFDEIQFDYVRFPTDGDTSRIRYPDKDDRSEQQVIGDFLAYARQQLRPEGVKVSADVFGLVTSFTDDMGIGQHLEDVAGAVDYVSPMLYPSHYSSGNLGLANPNAAPYQTVYRSLNDAKRRLAAAGLTDQTTMRPWLQDFTMGYDYGPDEVRSEIIAVSDAGYDQWLLWNAANVYTEAALRPKDLTRDDPFLLEAGDVGPAVSVALNGQLITGFDPAVLPVIGKTSGRTLVPLRQVTEALGATVSWDDGTRTATVAWNGHRVQLPVGGRRAQVDGSSTPLSQPAVIYHDRVVVPLRFLAEAFGATVDWNAEAERVDLTLQGVTCAPGYCAN